MSRETLIALSVTAAYTAIAALSCRVISHRRGIDDPGMNVVGVIAALVLAPMAVFGLAAILLNPVPLDFSTILSTEFGLDPAHQERNFLGRVLLFTSLIFAPFLARDYVQRRQELADDVILDRWRDERLARLAILNGHHRRYR